MPIDLAKKLAIKLRLLGRVVDSSKIIWDEGYCQYKEALPSNTLFVTDTGYFITSYASKRYDYSYGIDYIDIKQLAHLKGIL